MLSPIVIDGTFIILKIFKNEPSPIVLLFQNELGPKRSVMPKDYRNATASDFLVTDEYTIDISDSLRGIKRKNAMQHVLKLKIKVLYTDDITKNPEMHCHHKTKTIHHEDADIIQCICHAILALHTCIPQ